MAKQPRVTDVVQRAIADSVDRLVVHEIGVLHDDDVTAVHQARVATRRLRSDLHTFGRLLQPVPVQELRAELRWLGAELGAVRDLDVLRARLHEHAERLPAAHADTAERVARRLDADRHEAGREVVATLQSARYEQLREALLRASSHPPFSEDAPSATTTDVAKAVTRPWKRLRDAVDDLGDEPSDDALHQVRIRAKRLRYAAEASEPLFGKPMRRFAKAVTAVQEVLGEHHDSVVAEAWIAKAAEQCSTSEAYAAGMLAQVEREFAFAARSAFAESWPTVRAAHRSLRT
jgi:CHAD domain-containing protein